MSAKNSSSSPDLSLAIQKGEVSEVLTARIAGKLEDMELDVSPSSTDIDQACRNMAKALNIALQGDFLETRLEPVYEAARVHEGTVHILHQEYIGLGDGVMASIGRAAKSFTLSLRGPDPAAVKLDEAPEDPEPGARPVTGMLNWLARKLDLVQEYEDMVPHFTAQTLDRLESVRLVKNWSRTEWEIETTTIGLDVVLTPKPDGDARPIRR
ncbi:MAG: hypothetical protein AAF196_12965 [Planctomycetota bacterium]